MNAFHLAQLNIGRLRFPLDAAHMSEFRDLLDEINALADDAPGFVWRLRQCDADSTPFVQHSADMILINMSVWTSIETLERYVYSGAHLAVMKRRQEWFQRMADMHLVLWWIPAGHVPTVHEAAARHASVVRNGSTAEAFTFTRPFPPVAQAMSGSQR